MLNQWLFHKKKYMVPPSNGIVHHFRKDHFPFMDVNFSFFLIYYEDKLEFVINKLQAPSSVKLSVTVALGCTQIINKFNRIMTAFNNVTSPAYANNKQSVAKTNLSQNDAKSK